MSVNTKMTALADEVRTLSGSTASLGIDAMTNAVKGGNDEISGQSDLIAQISEALEGKAAPGGGITPTGTIKITENGTHDVTNYASANVNVPSVEPIIQSFTATKNGTYTPPTGVHGYSPVKVQIPVVSQAIPSISVDSSSGKITVTATQAEGFVYSGTQTATKQLLAVSSKSITPSTVRQTAVSSGRYTVGPIYVNPIPEQYIVPEGTAEITENGEHDVSEYASVNVIVPDVPAVVEELNVTENGEYTPGDGVDGFSRVTVNVPAGTTEIWTFTMEDGSEVTKDVVVT